MAFRAFVNGELRAAWSFSDDEWQSLREEVKRGGSSIYLPCCRDVGYPGKGFQRVSSLGTKHFYHAPDENNPCAAKGESMEHMELKYQIMQHCLEAGCKDVDVEVSFKDFRADVCCKALNSTVYTENITMVFEVQLSPITYEELVRRNLLYVANGIQCVWLLAKFPSNISNTSILNQVVRNPLVTAPPRYDSDVYPPFKDPKYRIYAENRLICVLINSKTGEVGYPKNESKTSLGSFVKGVVLGFVHINFENVIYRRRSGLVDFLYSRQKEMIPYTSIEDDVRKKIFQERERIYTELLTQQKDILKHHKDLCRERIFKEAEAELKEYEQKLRQALQKKEREKLAAKFLLQAQFDVPVYGDPIDVFVGTSSGKGVKVYDKRMFD